MKLKLLLIASLFTTSLFFAQSKVGTIDTELIVGKMPQMKDVLVRINAYAKELDSSYQIKTTAYKEKIEAFKKVEKTLTEQQRKEKIQELAALEQEMGKFRQNGTTLMKLRRDEYIRPLYKKLNEVIQEIAKSEGYTQVLTTSGNEFAFIDPNFDLTKKVMAKLGIQE
ncbi:conserved exported hypothetical protein [Tenacibaculum litopenaei]|jgi:outer membrane protein|uniref:OmpH family outer membrane protein n=1 Tax=Tenacibaculum litopenaei TaxID=396016 RepID=UPI00389642E0